MKKSSTLTDASLYALIDQAYASLEHEESWTHFLRALMETLAGTGAVSLQHDLVRQGAVLSSTGLDPDQLRLYQEHYHEVDPWTTGPVARQLVVPGAVLIDEALVRRADFRKTEFFSFVEPQGLSRLINTTLERNTRSAVSVSVYRASKDPAFGDGETAFLRALAPHLARVMRLRVELRARQAQTEASLRGLDALRCGAMLLSRSGAIIAANALAKEMLAASDGLRDSPDGLRATSAPVTARLRALIAGLGLPGEVLPHAPFGALLVPRAPPKPPLEVWVSPTGGPEPFQEHDSRGCVLVIIDEPQDDRRPSTALLQRFYGLTAMEARVTAILATGAAPDAVAAECRYTRETARWYCKQVLQKTGCRNRGELVRKFSRRLLSVEY